MELLASAQPSIDLKKAFCVEIVGPAKRTLDFPTFSSTIRPPTPPRENFSTVARKSHDLCIISTVVMSSHVGDRGLLISVL